MEPKNNKNPFLNEDKLKLYIKKVTELVCSLRKELDEGKLPCVPPIKSGDIRK